MSGGAQSALFAEQPITEFKAEHRFLSNFYVHVPVVVGLPWWDPNVGTSFPSVEHAFQAAKVEPGEPGFTEHYKRIATAGLDEQGRGTADPGLAKRLGSPAGFQGAGATLRSGWDQGVKVMVMLACLRAKFHPTRSGDDGELARLLIATSPRVLVEGNTWGDTYWGVYDGRGKNMLGRLLMLVRAELLCARASGLRPEELR